MNENKEFRACLAPFSHCHSSGPYKDAKTGRLYINLLGDWGGATNNKSYLYARYLYSVHTGALTPKGYDVDHIDGNRLNDSIKNLRLLPHIDNLAKGKSDPFFQTLKMHVKLICPYCKKEVIIL